MKAMGFKKPAWLAADPEMPIYKAARILAALPFLDHEHQRRAVAKHFGVRVVILDPLIKQAVEACERREYPPYGCGPGYATWNWPDEDHPDHPHHPRHQLYLEEQRRQ